MPRKARADAYPSRAARIIVGVPAGGSSDIQARLIGQWLSERLGQPYIVENRPGGGTNIATEAVVRAPADGYTLLLVTAINTWNASLYEKLNFNFVRDIAPVASLNRQTFVMTVTPSSPAKNVPEFIAYAKANPGKLNMASAGNATAGHVVGELFKMMAGLDTLHVPYRGAPPAHNRSHDRGSAGLFRSNSIVNRTDQRRQAARSGSHLHQTCRSTARPSAHG